MLEIVEVAAYLTAFSVNVIEDAGNKTAYRRSNMKVSKTSSTTSMVQRDRTSGVRVGCSYEGPMDAMTCLRCTLEVRGESQRCIGEAKRRGDEVQLERIKNSV